MMDRLSVFVIFSIIIGATSDAPQGLPDGSNEWNVDNTCFTKADNQTFNFTISASNSSRKYTGTTYRETDDPKVQRIHVKDPQSEQRGVYEFHFTDMELLSGEEFCRSYNHKIIDDCIPNDKICQSLVG